MEKCACTCKSCNIMLAFLLPNTKVYVTLETRLFCHDIFCVSGTSTTVAPARKRRATRGAASSRPKRVRGGRGRGQTRPAALATTPARGVGRGRGLTRPAAASTTPAGRVGRGRGQTRQRQQRRLDLQNSASRTSLIGARGCPYSARSKDTQGKTTWPTRSPRVPGIIHHVPSLNCTVIGWTRERFVALGLPSWTHLRTRYWGVFTLQGLKRFASCAWPTVLRKLGIRLKGKGESWFHYTNVLFVGVVRIAEMWFYSVLYEKKQPAEKIVENCWAMRSRKPRLIVIVFFKWP